MEGSKAADNFGNKKRDETLGETNTRIRNDTNNYDQILMLRTLHSLNCMQTMTLKKIKLGVRSL